MNKQTVRQIRDMAGLPRPIEEKDPKRLAEAAGETARQWYAKAPSVVKHHGVKYTLKKNATVKDGETVYFKYWAKKPKGEVMAPIIQFVVAYNGGSDLYDVTIESYDINMNKTGSRLVQGLGWENFANFGFMRDVMQESREVADAKLQDDLREFAGPTKRVRDEPDQYGSFEDAIKDMQAQMFDGRRGVGRPRQDPKE